VITTTSITRPGRAARVTVAALTGMLLLAGCVPNSVDDPYRGDPAPPGQPASADWQPCPEVPERALAGLAPPELIDQLLDGVSFECTTVPVPQDWDHPESAEQFEIEVVRSRDEAQTDRIGSLVLNPGGPGASGVDTAVYLSLAPMVGGLPESVTRRFDIVGFDPRGVARSSPVECYSDPELDESFAAPPDPVSDQEFNDVVSLTEQVVEGRAVFRLARLDHYSTRATAHDLDAIRAAVGDDQLTYLGYSYGTLLGAVYAQLYPQRVRAMVLDGAVDPEQDSVESSRGQAAGFERAFDNFSQWCQENSDLCPLQPDPGTAVRQAMETAQREPLTGADGRQVTAGWVLWAVISALYQQDLWPVLAGALDQLEQGDPNGVFDLVDSYTGRDEQGNYPNLFDALSAINCVDDPGELTVPQVRDLQEQWREEYPLFGAPLAISLLNCALWPAEADPYPTGPADGAPPILVIGTTGDPATPYESTQRLAEMLGVGVVVTNEGEGHTAYPGTPCVDELVDSYLVDLTVPASGTTCPG
jgi:pimeloyl-ACP methyl ester carboxylesterase